MEYLLLIEREKVTLEFDTKSCSKGGKPIRISQQIDAKKLRSYYPEIYRNLVIAEIECVDWYFGRRSNFEQIVLKQGLFSFGLDRYSKEYFCEPLIEESTNLPRPLGNGTAVATCYTQEAYNEYTKYIWPNGRKAVICTKKF